MAASSDALAQALEAMSRFFVGDATLKEALQNVAELACETVPAATMVGITMLVEGRARTAVFTDDTAPLVDSAQYETGAGPCLDALRHRQVYRIEATEDDRQWPAFSEAATAQGIKSTMSLPLLARHEGVGALNFYAREPSAFSDGDVQVGLQFAAYAAVVLANSKAYWDARHLSDEMTESMSCRATIEQAKGILMGAQHCSADDAFHALVQKSQRENRTVGEIAELIVARAANGQSVDPLTV